MPIYVYETVAPPHDRFEVRQSMKEEALTRHPQTGEPVRRVISSGFGYLQKGGTASPARRAGEEEGAGPAAGVIRLVTRNITGNVWKVCISKDHVGSHSVFSQRHGWGDDAGEPASSRREKSVHQCAQILAGMCFR